MAKIENKIIFVIVILGLAIGLLTYGIYKEHSFNKELRKQNSTLLNNIETNALNAIRYHDSIIRIDSVIIIGLQGQVKIQHKKQSIISKKYIPVYEKIISTNDSMQSAITDSLLSRYSIPNKTN